LDLVAAGRPIAQVAKALGSSDQSTDTWRRQDRIDRGLEPGLNSAEKSELAAAKRRIAELETELHASAVQSSWSERWCPQKAVPGGRGDGRRTDRGRGRLPGVGRVDLGLRRLAISPAVQAGDPPCLADRSDRRGPPALSRHLRGASGACRAAAWPRGRGRPQRRALLLRRAGLAGATGRAKWRHAKPDQIATDLVERNFARTGPNELRVTDSTEHPTREGKVYCAVVLEPTRDGWSAGRSMPRRRRRW
jgi:hypothetical protein